MISPPNRQEACPPDLPPTILPQLGANDATEDYCLGFDLFGPMNGPRDT